MDGNLLLYVVNEYGQPRSYRVDRIVGVRAAHAVHVTPGQICPAVGLQQALAPLFGRGDQQPLEFGRER